MQKSFYDEFVDYAGVKSLFNSDTRILLAVSGGIDSMVMTHLFLRLGQEIAVAHCNFSLRGEESDRDEELVKEFCTINKLPFFRVRFQTMEYASKKSVSIQMAARELRYGWFEKIRNGHDYDLIATAHNLNDNVETLLINLTRGTGLTGLSAMKPVSGTIIRPLLFATRDRIAAYCCDNRIDYREDSSNSLTKYTRNKIRHLVMPVLREINPSADVTISRVAGKLAALDEILQNHISGLRKEISENSEGNIIFSIAGLKSLKGSSSMIYELFLPYGITEDNSVSLHRLLDSTPGKQIFTKTHRILRDRDKIIVTPSEDQDLTLRIELDSPDELGRAPGIASAEIIIAGPDSKIPRTPDVACIDLEKITFPLIIRRWQKGDYFYPLGMQNRKKLSDYFTDRKYSGIKKEKAAILESDGKIVWIIGERLDDRYKVSQNTVRILVIRVSPGR